MNEMSIYIICFAAVVTVMVICDSYVESHNNSCTCEQAKEK